MIDRVVSFFVTNTLPFGYWVTLLPPFMLWAAICLGTAAWLRCRRGVHIGYTRKVFHFLIFGSSVVIQLGWGTPMLCLFGGAVSLVILLAVLLGDGNPLFEAIARPTDAPYRTYYVVVSYLATLMGGLLANIFFGNLAVTGYLVAGLGDALGEPVGTRFGKHPYCLALWRKGVPRRTLEGSLAVGLGSAVAASLAAVLLHVPFAAPLLVASVGLGFVSALVEAAAPHGWDNAVLQFIPTLLAWMVF